MQLLVNGNDITPILKEVIWSGEEGQVARKLEFSYISSPSDVNIPAPQLSLGNLVQLIADNGKEVFTGFIFTREKTSSLNTIRVMAYDGAIYLLKNRGSYKFKDVPAETITRTILSSAGLPIGDLASTGINLRFIVTDKSLHDTIKEAYQKASEQNGKKYYLVFEGGKIHVREVGKVKVAGTLEEGLNLRDSSYSETIENVVNKVVVLDRKYNRLNVIVDANSVKNYGSFETSIQPSPREDAIALAQSVMQGVEREASVSGMGNTDLITGYGVSVKDTYTGVIGNFVITGDTHRWLEDSYTVQLSLRFMGEG